MALSFDKYVVSVPGIKPYLDLSLNFVGFFTNWSTTDITDCSTSSRWSECVVNTYHLCGQAAVDRAAHPQDWRWWDYSTCLYAQQYPAEECAGLNPLDANHTCTRDEFPGIIRGVSDACAQQAGLDATALNSCYDDGRGLALLKASFAKTLTFPRNPHGYTEPQWLEVDGPSCDANFTECEPSFDKTACLDWDDCDSDAWAKHLLAQVCAKTDAQTTVDACQPA